MNSNKQKKLKLDLCPCHSSKAYETCCKPFHEGLFPENALKLMRSRYAAYALNLPAYLISTTHPANPHWCNDHQKWAERISAYSLGSEFHNLEILDFQEQGDVATVTFVAHLSQNDQDATFTEMSTFEKVNGKWLYRNGERKPRPGA